jgi:hypothetical protein
MRTGTMIALIGVVSLVAMLLGQVSVARAQLFAPNLSTLRYQLIGDEPIATPDGKSVVNAMKALTLRDKVSNQCYVAFLYEHAMAVNPTACP